MRYFTAVLLIAISCVYPLFVTAQDARILYVQFHFDINLENVNKFKLVCVIAKDIDNIQKIENIRYSIVPDTIYDKGRCRYAEFVMEGSRKSSHLEINTLLEIYPHDLKKVRKNKGAVVTNDSSGKYLIDEQYIEVDDEIIQQKAKELQKEEDIKTVENIYKFVTKHIKDSEYYPDAIGAKQALLDKKGDCTEYTDLFVALCRANSIPARHIHGYISGDADNPRHSWAEAFIDDLGWVQFDPSPNNGAKFSEVTRAYVNMTSIRNDENVKGGNYFLYYWWGDKKPEVKNTVTVKEYSRR